MSLFIEKKSVQNNISSRLKITQMFFTLHSSKNRLKSMNKGIAGLFLIQLMSYSQATKLFASTCFLFSPPNERASIIQTELSMSVFLAFTLQRRWIIYGDWTEQCSLFRRTQRNAFFAFPSLKWALQAWGLLNRPPSEEKPFHMQFSILNFTLILLSTLRRKVELERMALRGNKSH